MGNEVKTTEHLLISLDDLVVEFASNFSLGMKAVVAAAETYVTALRKFPNRARDEFAARFPGIRPDTWKIIEDVGRGKLPPQATMMAPGAVAKLREAKLPPKVFDRIAEAKVSVYNPSTREFVDVPFTHLTEMQADIILNPVTHSLRSAEQQKRYVKKVTEAERDRPRVETKRWAVVGDSVVIKKMTTLTAEDILAIAKEMHLFDKGEVNG